MAIPPVDHVRELVNIFGSQRRAAEFAGVGHSQIARWLEGGSARERSVRRLADAVSVIEALRKRGLDDGGLVAAVSSSWLELGGARPAELLPKGGVHDILRAVTQRYPRPKPSAPTAEPSLAETLLALAAAAQASAHALQRESKR